MKTNRASYSIASIALFLIAGGSAIAGAPAAPSPVAPAKGASVQLPFAISWSSVTDPSGIVAYNWQVSPSSAFTPIILQNSTNGATQDTVSGIANGTYFWRVQAVNGQFVQGNWSGPSSFLITGAGAGSPSTPTMNPPKGYSTFHPFEDMTFTWNAVANAATYTMQFSTDPAFPVTAATGKFDNLPTPTMTFAMADPNTYYARVFAVSSSGISSQPSNTINYSVQFNNPLPAPPQPVSPANGTTTALPVTLTWSDVPNPQPSGYEIQISKNSSFSSIEEDDPQLNEPSRQVLSLTPGAKFWRVRSAQGDASPTTAAETAWSATGTFTIPTAPPTPTIITFTSNPIAGGNTTWVQIQLSAAVGASGATINLASSNQTAAPLPATVTMPPNLAWTQFQAQVGQVTASTDVTITATLNGASASAVLTVQPPALSSLSMSPSTINGGQQTSAFVMLNGQAPPGGAVVSLSSNSAAAMPPSTATVPAGSFSAVVPVPTASVTGTTAATITGAWNGVTLQAPLTIVTSLQPASIALSPASVTGTAGSFATITVASTSTVDQFLQVTSSNPSVASTPGSVTIPAGSTTGGFSIFTSSVTAQTIVTISVAGGGVTKSAQLTLNPASSGGTTTSSLTVSATGRSGESLLSSPAGIKVATGSSQTASFTTGTSITLSVTNGRDAIWSGACSSGGNKAKTCTFKLNANSSVTGSVQ
jgi:hypothetical protein